MIRLQVLTFTTYVDTTLENIKAAKASNTNKGALALSGTGTVTIKDGVYDGGEKEGLAVEGTPAMTKAVISKEKQEQSQDLMKHRKA